MTIDEAKEILALELRGEYKGTRLRLEEAYKLGIEALQFFKGAQREAGGYQELHLQGETES